ncbi:apolipoprotein D-like isoform X1 [Oncorhynchus clarkii lewisi]|uniref:apolipoprotein D-like isoform X1 n=2 Tax=Oncorhynchus clarkii lewisi TaxID=490388 RepID=UPI0039B8F6AE
MYTGPKMQTLQVLSLTLLSILAANAQTLRPGKCPQPPVQANFDAARYLGKWYEIKKLPAVFQKGECTTATYSLESPGIVGVLNRELLADNTVSAITGYAKAKDPSEPAKLEVTFFEDSPPGNYWVLSTDYEGHSVVYGCTDILGTFHADFAWILSRESTLSEEKLEELYHVFTSNGIDIDVMTVTNQSPELCADMPLWA